MTDEIHRLDTFVLGPYTLPRLWVGLWQLSSPAWGTAPVSKIKAEMHAHLAAGYTTFADHYGSAEILFGQFRQACIAGIASSEPSSTTEERTNPLTDISQKLSLKNLPTGSPQSAVTSPANSRASSTSPKSLTAYSASSIPICADKWCIFRNPTVKHTRSTILEGLRERIHRTLSDGLDILQIHWQDYSDPSVYLDAFREVISLRKEGVLRINVLGLCNFDTKRVVEICEAMGKGEILTNQIQFSLIDVRPLYGMTEACEKYGVKLVTYGTFCGGFLSDAWLGRAQPDPYRDTITPSQRKYLDVILNAWGGWDLFQVLLKTLRTIADRHSDFGSTVSIANVATRWVLDQPAVGAVIVGARLGVTEHRADNARVFRLRLSAEDNSAVGAVLARSNGSKLINVMGDCGAEYR